MKTYEATFIFPSALKEDVVAKNMDRIRDELGKMEGVAGETQVLGTREFARRLHKKEAGTYVRMNFNVEPAKLAAFQARLKLNEEIFRTMIVESEKQG